MTAIAPGTADVSAACESKLGRVTVSVHSPGPVVTVDVPPTLIVDVGAEVQLMVVLRDSNRVVVVDRPVTYRSADTTIATVSPSGTITGITRGATFVTAESEGQSGVSGVVVRAAPLGPCPPIPANRSVASAFKPVGPMRTAGAADAVTLPDGRVVVFTGGTTLPPMAEVYDPSTQAFSPAEGMMTTRGKRQAVVLQDGRLIFRTGVLLEDGTSFFADSVAEVYDPGTDTFKRLGAYAHPSPVVWETVTPLQDGRVLLAGFQGSFAGGSVATGATELFDPKTGTFIRTGPMQGWSDTVAWGVLLTDGTVLFVQWAFELVP